MIHNISDYVGVALALHALAIAIVNLTPTPKDDEAMSSAQAALVKLYRAIEVIAGIIGPLAKR